jgi:hypothetical protein
LFHFLTPEEIRPQKKKNRKKKKKEKKKRKEEESRRRFQIERVSASF